MVPSSEDEDVVSLAFPFRRGSEYAILQRPLVPNTSKGLAFGTRVLKFWVPGPSGFVCFFGRARHCLATPLPRFRLSLPLPRFPQFPMATWTSTVCKIMACWAILDGLGLVFNMLFRTRGIQKHKRYYRAL